MIEFAEDRVYARHHRRRGAALIVGVGAVGGLAAQELAAMGISPLWLVDKERLEVENLVRHPLGAEDLGQPKAVALADQIRRDLPVCNAVGLFADFLELAEDEQLRIVRQADVVVAATDSVDCQRRVNEVCLAAQKPAIYPAVWVDPRVRDAEVGEILWVLPGRHTPCYECSTLFRQGAADTQAGRGARVDIQLVSLTTAQVVAALLDPADERSGILDPERTAIYIHGLTPTSPGVRTSFPTGGLQSRNVRVPFPPTPCPACGGQESPLRQAPRPEPAIEPVRSGNYYLQRRMTQIFVSLTLTAFILAAAILWAVNQLTGGPTGPAAISAPTSESTPVTDSATSQAPQTTAPATGQGDNAVASPEPATNTLPEGMQPPEEFPKDLSLSCSYSITGYQGDFLPCPVAGPNAVRLRPGLGGTENLLLRFTIEGLSWSTWYRYWANNLQGYTMNWNGPDGVVFNTSGDDQPTPVETSSKPVYVQAYFGSAPIYGDFVVRIIDQNSMETVERLVLHAVR